MFDLLEAGLIDKDSLVDKAKTLSGEGYRLIQMHCTKTETEMFLIYSFEKMGLELLNFRMDITDGETLPSLSGVYAHACLYENETSELFGVKIAGMAIDFKGSFYETAKPHAFNETAGSSAADSSGTGDASVTPDTSKS